MCSGKSKVGRVLSSFLGYPFLDTDELIEELTKQKISAIFAQDGEEAFREMETQILQVHNFSRCSSMLQGVSTCVQGKSQQSAAC